MKLGIPKQVEILDGTVAEAVDAKVFGPVSRKFERQCVVRELDIMFSGVPSQFFDFERLLRHFELEIQEHVERATGSQNI